MDRENYIGAITETEVYVDDSEEGQEEEIGFITMTMLEKLMALKVAEGHESFEALFEELLKDHAYVRQTKQ